MKTIARWALALSLAACGSSPPSTPDAATTGAQACAAVGTAICHQVYACYTAQQISDLQYPATEAECVTQENVNCAQLMPGFCKSGLQVSTSAAQTCAAELVGESCAQFTRPPTSDTDPCSNELCTQ